MGDHLQEELTWRYRVAYTAWLMLGSTGRELAKILGMSHREYCDSYVRFVFPPLTWTSAGSDAWQPDVEQAYREAGHDGFVT